MKSNPLPSPTALYRRIAQILESAQAGVARTVNTTQVVANWLVGREIVEEEQHGAKRAEYGGRLLEELSRKLTQDFGVGYSVQGLRHMPIPTSCPPCTIPLPVAEPSRWRRSGWDWRLTPVTSTPWPCSSTRP